MGNGITYGDGVLDESLLLTGVVDDGGVDVLPDEDGPENGGFLCKIN